MARQMLHIHDLGIPIVNVIIYSAVVVLIAKETTATSFVAKPNCPDKCWNITVPYPFGIGKDCYLNQPFEVICNHSTKSAYLPNIEAQLFEISMGDHRLRIAGPALAGCHNESSGKSTMGLRTYISDPKFRISRSQNKWVTIGCDVFAYTTETDTDKYISGCAAFCYNTSNINAHTAAYVNISSCSGIGCCRTSLPKNLFSFHFHIYTMNTDSPAWRSSQCSVVFVAEETFSDFNRYAKLNFSGVVGYQVLDGPPALLDWTVANISCREALLRPDYACGHNSRCIDASHGQGYTCHCSVGFQGNPYLLNGCQDIDECMDPKKNACGRGASCTNTEGSYSCRCPLGYHSDDGYGCRPEHTILISLGSGIAISILALTAVCILSNRKFKEIQKHRIKQNFFKRNGGMLLEQQISSDKENVVKTRLFLTEELEKATENFNGSRIIGKGGLGTVYKGMLSDGRIVAVKKSNMVDQNRIGQFINEVIILSHINHRNIVKLLGCCLETEVPLLVYEYVSNGTLSHHLHEVTNACKVSWRDRMRIAGEVAGALAYLHSYASTAIFHRDIKPTNILLDENYRAVVSDFGLSRSVPLNRTHLTTVVGGTFGYLDPEYFRSGQLTDKSDVYSFGVVLVELLTGIKVVSSNSDDEGLVFHFQSSMKQKRLFEILERRVVDEGGEEEIHAVAALAKRCLKLCSRKRPSMKEVVAELEQLRRMEVEPILVQQNSPDSYSSAAEMSNSGKIDHSVEEDGQEHDIYPP